jgi:outer membrane protein OmpA-like peptidoglycan-associated protein/Tol biopolymer transport system component
MYFFYRVFLLSLFLFCSQLGFAQKELKAFLKQGEEHMLAEEYTKALEQFKAAEKLAPEDPELAKDLAECYLALDQHNHALKYLLICRDNKLMLPRMEFEIGRGYHENHQFDLAIQSFEKYKASLKHNSEEFPEVEIFIQYCLNGKEYMKKPVEVTIKNLGPLINSKYPDYMPAISADESVIVFTSRRDNTVGGKMDDDGHYMEDIYMSLRSDTIWTTPTHMSTTINTESHDACVAISPDGQELFVYRHSGKDGGDLYVCNLIGSVWSSPTRLPSTINTDYWEPSASVTSDENTLFFVSNKKGGLGERDIYMAKRLPNGTWGEAKNLGTKINTALDEESPFIHPDGKTLYFSSKGHKSMGGFDIFYCEIDVETGEIKSDVQHVGYPINTAGDDVFFSWTPDNKRAYFSSEREGGYGEKDLYVLERKEAKAALVVYKGTIIGCDKNRPVTATIVVTDLNTQQPVGIYNTNSSTGKYTVILPAGKNYGIAVEAKGFMFYSKNIDIPDLDHYMEIKDTICMERMEVGTEIVLRNIFFDVDKATLRKESVNELERLYKIMKDNPTLKIEIAGHTDSDGTDEHNMTLSHNRAKAVYDYVVNKGIDANRMTWKGYGESQPEAPNDTPENKQRNRRTVIKVLEG